MAGLLRGVRPIGDWSTLMTLSKCSMPSMLSCAAGSSCARYNVRATAAYSVSLRERDAKVEMESSPRSAKVEESSPRSAKVEVEVESSPRSVKVVESSPRSAKVEVAMELSPRSAKVEVESSPRSAKVEVAMESTPRSAKIVESSPRSGKVESSPRPIEIETVSQRAVADVVHGAEGLGNVAHVMEAKEETPNGEVETQKIDKENTRDISAEMEKEKEVEKETEEEKEKDEEKEIEKVKEKEKETVNKIDEIMAEIASLEVGGDRDIETTEFLEKSFRDASAVKVVEEKKVPVVTEEKNIPAVEEKKNKHGGNEDLKEGENISSAVSEKSEKTVIPNSNSNSNNEQLPIIDTTNGHNINNNISQEKINARENLTFEFKKIYSAENNKSLGDILEMHNDACLLLGDFNITPKSSSRRGSGTNTPGTYIVN